MKSTIKHDCRDELHNAKLRVTPARLGVLAMLEHADMPVDVSMITDYLKKQKIPVNEVTVFRILNTFTDKGITKPIQLNEGKLRYEYANKAKHHHFICEKCKTITDVEGCTVEALERQIEKTSGGKVTRHSLEFFGLCRRCVS
jgi:Fe2+ or Zn2+ uptake regulation protein